MADNAMDYRPRFQWEPSSGTFDRSQSNNCGPTGAAQQIDYYLSRKTGSTRIENLRTVAGIPHGTPTSAWDQAEMLTRMGIPSTVISFKTMDQLDRMLGKDGNRPIGIGILMSRLRPETRGHNFTGWHRVTLLRRAFRKINGVSRRGYWYTDPNFSPPGGIRPDPHKGHRWINRRELEYAWLENPAALGIVPNKRKVGP